MAPDFHPTRCVDIGFAANFDRRSTPLSRCSGTLGKESPRGASSAAWNFYVWNNWLRGSDSNRRPIG
jgi:hypothetical protein